MLMRIIMSKTEILTKKSQEDELNTTNTLGLINASVQHLKQIRIDDYAVNAEFDAMKSFAEKEGIDAIAQYQRHHQPQRVDENPQTASVLSIQEFYGKELYA